MTVDSEESRSTKELMGASGESTPPDVLTDAEVVAATTDSPGCPPPVVQPATNTTLRSETPTLDFIDREYTSHEPRHR